MVSNFQRMSGVEEHAHRKSVIMRQKSTHLQETAGQFETGRQGDKETSRISPCLPLSLSPCLSWIASHELWLLAAAAPFLFFPNHPNRWTPLAFALIPLTWLCRRMALGRFTIHTAMDVPIGILLVMTLVSLYPSVDLSLSLPSMWRIILGMAIFYGLVNALRTESDLHRIVTLLLLISIGATLTSLLATDWNVGRLFFDLPGIYDRMPRLLKPVGGSLTKSARFHPRVVSMTMAMLLPLPISLLVLSRRRDWRFLSGAAVLIMVPTLLLTQGLPAFLGLGAAMVFIGTWWSRWFLLSVPLGLGGLVLATQHYGVQGMMASLFSVDHPLGLRLLLHLEMWQRALHMIRDMPYTGIGLSTFPLILNNFYPGFLIGPEPQAHNLYLQTAVDLGLPGLLAFVWLLITFYYGLVRSYRACSGRDLRALLVGLAAGVLAYLVSGLLDLLIWGGKPTVALWAMLGLAAAVNSVATEPRAHEASSTTARIFQRLGGVHWIPLTLVLIMAGLAAMAPHSPCLNLGSLQAHKALLQTRTGGVPQEAGLRAASASLERVVRQGGANSHVYYLLGRIYSWLGHHDRAIDAFGRMVWLDGKGPLEYYAPSELLSGRKQEGDRRWEELVRVYSHWVARFPERSESYLLIAIVLHEHQGDSAGAVQMLEAGLQRAVPKGVLYFYRSQILRDS